MTKLRLLPHQANAISKLKDLKSSALFFEQGLGKTLVAIRLIEYWLARKDIESAVIITRRNLVQNWKREFHKFSDIPVFCPTVIGNSYSYTIFPSRNVFLMHYEGLPKRLNFFLEFVKNYKLALILDEAHYIKNPESKNFKKIISFSDFATRKVVLTGTPIPNRPFDLWAICRFLDQDIVKSVSYKNLKRLTDIPNTNSRVGRSGVSEYSLLQTHIHSLKDALDKISSFTFKNDMSNIPRKHFSLYKIRLTGALWSEYNLLLKDKRNVIVNNGDVKSKSDDCILRLYTQLIKYCSMPSLCSSHLRGPFPKDLKLLDVLKKPLRSSESSIIWTSFNETSKYLHNLLSASFPNTSVYLVNGKIPLKARNNIIDKFVNSQKSLLVATIGTCKEGLNLQNASTAVFYDSSYRLDDFLQAQDRIHRINQKRECKIVKLVYKDTIEEWILELIDTKEHLAKDVFSRKMLFRPEFLARLFARKEGIVGNNQIR
jgi:SNF2 family DNA or RNA helicase